MSFEIHNRYNGYHNRRSIRLPGYDYYRPGYYFITICIHDRTQRLFGLTPQFTPNQYGQFVKNTWVDLPNHISNIQLDEFVIMPDHIHGIIRIIECGTNPGASGTGAVGLPEMVRQLKTFSARRINKFRNTIGQPVWQRNYYEHIIQNGNALHLIRKYIKENPTPLYNDYKNHINKEILDFEMVEVKGAE